MSLPNQHGALWPLSWIGFVPLLLLTIGAPARQALRLWFLCGFVFWSATIFWLVHVTLAGTVLLVAYLSLYFGLFGFLAAYSFCPALWRFPLRTLLALPALWVLLEYTRSHLFTGFPWGLLGSAQYLNLPIIQIASLTGVWGVSYLVMAVNCALAVMVYARGADRRFPAATHWAVPVLLGAALVYGRATAPSAAAANGLAVCIVQGNIPQEMKWDDEFNAYIMHKYLNLTKDAARALPQLIVWPEASFPVALGSEEGHFFRLVSALAARQEMWLLMGAVTLRAQAYYNSAVLVGPDGRRRATYDKLHLVPFGEYIPLKKQLPFLQTIVPIGDITRGTQETVFSLEEAAPLPKNSPRRFSVLICFEDLFPELARSFVRRGAQFLVTVTNDAWYKKTTAAEQHLQASVLRAVENRVNMVRSANTGVSAFIGADGSLARGVRPGTGEGLFTDLTAYGRVPAGPVGGLSVYTRFGDVSVVVCALWCLVSLAGAAFAFPVQRSV